MNSASESKLCTTLDTRVVARLSNTMHITSIIEVPCLVTALTNAAGKLKHAASGWTPAPGRVHGAIQMPFHSFVTAI